MSFIVIISNLDEEDDESEDDDDDLEVEDEDLEVDDELVNQDYIQKNWHHSLHDKDYFSKNWHRSLDDEDYFNANANRNNQSFRRDKTTKTKLTFALFKCQQNQQQRQNFLVAFWTGNAVFYWTVFVQ
jgi:hypothetical protein